MNIYAKKGDKVIVTQSTKGYGSSYDQDQVSKYLMIDQVYHVDKTDVGSWSTDVYLEEVTGEQFNSVMFEDYRPTPPVQAKTAEEILHQTFERHNNDPNSKLGIIEIEVEAIEAYHAQFPPSAKSVEVEEDDLAAAFNLVRTVYKDRDIRFKSGFEIGFSEGSNWQQQKQADTISRLRESLKTIYSLAKPGSAIYDICDETLNQKK